MDAKLPSTQMLFWPVLGHWSPRDPPPSDLCAPRVPMVPWVPIVARAKLFALAIPPTLSATSGFVGSWLVC